MEEDNKQELYHYGVLGMKWGVRRATKSYNKAISIGNKEKAAKAITSLNKHKGKITKKLNKLDKEGKKLEKQRYNAITKSDVKAASLEKEIARLERKATKFYTSEKKSEKLILKANKLSIRVKEIKAYSDGVKAKVEKNKAMTETFKRTLTDVDDILIANGKKYIA